jgi:hypothetical protein
MRVLKVQSYFLDVWSVKTGNIDKNACSSTKIVNILKPIPAWFQNYSIYKCIIDDPFGAP